MKTITKIVIIAALSTMPCTYAQGMHERSITFYKQQIATLQKVMDNYSTLLPKASLQQKKAIYHAMSNLSKTIKMFKSKISAQNIDFSS